MRANMILADCRQEEVEDFASGLMDSTKEKFIVNSSISNWGRTGIFSNFKRYFKYFSFPFHIFCHRKEYDIIIGWQQFYALIFCFFCRLFHVKKTNIVAAVNYTYKEKDNIIGKLYRSFMMYIIQSEYLDYIHVPSYQYVDICCKALNADKSKFIVTTFGTPDLYEQYSKVMSPCKKPYVLSVGRSNRDYAFLINAWKGIDCELVIICDTFNEKTDNLPENIKIISDISGSKQYPYIANCEILILPIDDGTICSGDTVLLTAMSFKRPVVVTTPSTLAEMYIDNMADGICVEKDSIIFKRTITQLLNNSRQRIELGDNARTKYLNCFSRQSMGMKIGKMIRG